MSVLPRMTLGAPTGGLINDQRSEGWELLEEGPQVQEGESTLDFLGFLREGENSINGETMLVRAAGKYPFFKTLFLAKQFKLNRIHLDS